MLEVLADFLLGAGVLFTIAGTIGLLRFPDFYTRLHAAGVTETLGMLAIVAGLMLHAGPGDALVRLVLIASFMLATAPIASHALAKAARHAGVHPVIEDSGSSPGS